MVSVIITTYKRNASIVSRAVKSVISQTCSDWELFVIDDSPADWPERINVESAMSQFVAEDNRIRYIKHERNLGACAARNTGLWKANGEYIAYLDDDDEWVEEKLYKQLNVLDKADPSVALVYCGSIYYYEESAQSIPHKDTFVRGKVFDQLIMKNFIGGTSFPLIRTEALKAIEGFDDQMQSGQDLDAWLRLAQIYEIDYVAEPLVIYHLHEGEQISTSPKKRIAGVERRIYKFYEYFMSNHYQYNICLMDLACEYAFDQQVLQAIRTVWKGICIYPQNLINNIKVFFRIGKWYKLGRQKNH